MGRAARERYLKLFSSEAVLPMLQSAYVRLAGAHAHYPSQAYAAAAVAHPWEVVPEF